MKRVNLNILRLDGGTQSRVGIDESVVAHYAELIQSGVILPPVTVFHDGADHWLADGFHRFHAHRRAEKASIEVDLRTGTLREAILHSFGANKGHGLQPSNADKRKIVTAMLSDAEWSQWSDNKIAKECGFSASFVGDMRRSIFSRTKDAPAIRTVERAGKAYQQNTSSIGKSKATDSAKAAIDRTVKPQPPVDPALVAKLEDTQQAVAILSEDNDRLSDRLAVAAMDATEEERAAAAETIGELRAKVRTLEIELDAVKSSRDSLMRENNELKSQCARQRKQLDKLKATV